MQAASELESVRGLWPQSRAPRRADDAALVSRLLIGISLVFLAVFVGVPLGLVFTQAFAGGLGLFLATISDPLAVSAIRLTLLVAAVAVPANVFFGIGAAWLIAKFNFVGKGLLTTLLDLPLAVSPVISGMVFVLLFGAQGWFGPWLRQHDLKVIFAVPGIILATMFVTVPLVARELIPAMEASGNIHEEAALVHGAGGWTTFTRITLPKVRWALIYGVVLTNARAMGEFGAVSVVSGRIRGETNTIPLHAEILYNDYQTVGAFALASLLALLGLTVLVVHQVIAWRSKPGRSAPAPSAFR